jgi:predicted RNA-binding Zn-ribbon protein involved in translation (DUF1610 family)
MVNRVIRDSTERLLNVNPSLTYAEIARLLGVSRERIRQIAGRRRRHPRVCRVCGRLIKLLQNGVTQTAYGERFCPDCWSVEKENRRKAHYVTFTCETCGSDFTRKAGVVRRQQKAGQRVRWCSRRCHGKWLGAEYKYRHDRESQSAS